MPPRSRRGGCGRSRALARQERVPPKAPGCRDKQLIQRGSESRCLGRRQDWAANCNRRASPRKQRKAGLQRLHLQPVSVWAKQVLVLLVLQHNGNGSPACERKNAAPERYGRQLSERRARQRAPQGCGMQTQIPGPRPNANGTARHYIRWRCCSASGRIGSPGMARGGGTRRVGRRCPVAEAAAVARQPVMRRGKLREARHQAHASFRASKGARSHC